MAQAGLHGMQCEVAKEGSTVLMGRHGRLSDWCKAQRVPLASLPPPDLSYLLMQFPTPQSM